MSTLEPYKPLVVVRLFTYSVVYVLFTLLTFPGILLNYPVETIIRLYTSRKAEEARRTSTMKRQGTDVVASWKLLTAFVLLPLYYNLVSYALCECLAQGVLVQLILALLILPNVSLVSAILQEQRHYFKHSLLLMTHARYEDLRMIRDSLRHDMLLLIEAFGPDVVADFARTRLVEPQREDDLGWESVEVGELDDIFFTAQ